MDETQHPAPHPTHADPGGPDDLPLLAPPDEPLAIRTAEDILAYVPHALGEWPHESLVAVCLADGQLGPTLRIDLPGPRRQSSLRRFADTVAEYVAHGSPVGALLAVYTHREWTDPRRAPHRDVIDAVVARLAEEDVPVLESWVVGREHWRTATCGDIVCCPWPGTSVGSLRASRVEAELVYRGSAYGHTDLPEPRTASVAPAPALAAAIEACVQDPERWWDPMAFTAALAAWDEVLSGTLIPDASRLRLLAATLMRPALRDAVLVASAADATTAWKGSSATSSLQGALLDALPPALPGGVSAEQAQAALSRWSGGGRPASGAPTADGQTVSDLPAGPQTDAQTSGRHGGGAGGASVSPTAAEFGLVLMGATGFAPAWDRIARLERAAMSLAQMEEPEVRAPALSILAWIQWARGRGGRCLKFLERALSTDPDYRLAQLLRAFVEHGQLAGWALDHDTAWRGSAEAA